MIELVTQIIKAGPVGIFYVRRKTVFGNEAELRWKRYINSRNWLVKIDYNVSDADHAAIKHLIQVSMPGHARRAP